MRKFVIQMQLDLMQNPLTRSWQSLDLRGFPRGGNEIDKIPLTVIMEMLAHSFDLLFPISSSWASVVHGSLSEALFEA